MKKDNLLVATAMAVLVGIAQTSFLPFLLGVHQRLHTCSALAVGRRLARRFHADGVVRA